MTTLLSTKQVDALRSIGDSAIVLLALWMIDANFPGRHTKETELLPLLRPTIKDNRKLTGLLDALCASGRITKTSAGYVLLEGGKALILGMNTAETLALSPEAISGAKSFQNEGAKVQVIDADSAGENYENLTRKLRALKKEEEDNFNLRDMDSSSSESTQKMQNLALEIAPGVTTLRILKATPMLDRFGDGVFTHKLNPEQIEPREALGLIAQAFDQRTRPERPNGINSPANYVYTHLRDEKYSQGKYSENWESYLPEDFLMEIGWLEIVCPACGVNFEDSAALKEHLSMMMVCEYGCDFRCHTAEELEAHYLAEHRANQSTVYSPLAETERGYKAWKMVFDALLAEAGEGRSKERAALTTWLERATPVCVTGDTLTLVAANSYAKDFIENRFKSTVDVRLKAYTGGEITKTEYVIGDLE